MKLLAYTLLSLLPLGAFASDEGLLQPFFGYYRAMSYNGVDNTYSRKFFVPTINTSPSVKLRRETGEPFKVLSFGFEVPIEEEEGIALRYIFPEVPLDGAEIKASPKGVEIHYSGKILERDGDEWHSCAATYEASLQNVGPELIGIELKKTAEAPCTSESHSILAAEVKFMEGQ